MKEKTIFRESYKALIKELIKAREDQHLTQKDLAQKLNWRQSDISKIEHRVRRIDVLEFVEICSALELDYKKLVDDIIDQTD